MAASGDRRTRDFQISRVFERAFGVFQDHWGVITFLTVALVGLPFGLLGQLRATETGWPTTIALLLFLVLAVLAKTAAIQISLVAAHGRSVTLDGTMSRAIRALPGMLLISLVTLLGCALGFVLLIIPGIFAATVWALAGPAKLEERWGVIDTLQRSYDLVSGARWRVFAVLLILWGSNILSFLATRIALITLKSSDAFAARTWLLDPLCQMIATVLGALVCASMYHELAWGPSGPEETTAEIFD